MLDDKLRKAVSKIDATCSQLRIAHSQSLFCVLQYGLALLFDYWLQHAMPADAAPRAE